MRALPRHAAALMALLAATTQAWTCPVVQSNESPAGPTPVPTVSIGKRGVDGLVVVAGGGGMSAVEVNNTGAPGSSGLSGTAGPGGTILCTEGLITFKTALSNTTGTVTQTSTGITKVIPTGPIVFVRGSLFPTTVTLDTGNGRYITPPGGSAEGTASFNSVTEILMDPTDTTNSVTVDPTDPTKLQIYGTGLLKNAIGTITGGQPVFGGTATPIPAGPSRDDTNVRYSE